MMICFFLLIAEGGNPGFASAPTGPSGDGYHEEAEFNHYRARGKDWTMRHAVYAGSFDPITNGHLWMIENGSRMFETLTVAIGANPDKKYLFTLAERMEMIAAAAAPFTNVKVSSFENLFLVNYARKIGASFILRGIRNEQDYGYERGMRYVNAELNPEILTVFLMPPREYAEISSSFVKGLVGPEGWQEITKVYVPSAVHAKLLSQFWSKP